MVNLSLRFKKVYTKSVEIITPGIGDKFNDLMTEIKKFQFHLFKILKQESISKVTDMSKSENKKILSFNTCNNKF